MLSLGRQEGVCSEEQITWDPPHAALDFSPGTTPTCPCPSSAQPPILLFQGRMLPASEDPGGLQSLLPSRLLVPLFS